MDQETANTADIALHGVTKRFGEMTAVDDLTLDIPRGSFFALLGPSGCGKTTTLRMIGGFEEPTAGRIELAGKAPGEGAKQLEANNLRIAVLWRATLDAFPTIKSLDFSTA